VTDADSPIGEQIVLQLILARAVIRAVVKDTTAARTAYGPYVTPVSLDTGNADQLRRVLKGCGSVVCAGRPGAWLEAAAAEGVAHVVLLSAVGQAQGGFMASLLGDDLAPLRDPAREAAVVQCGRRYSIVRVAGAVDSPGGQSALSLLPGTASLQGGPQQPVSREDLAAVVVQALLRPPTAGRTFQVVPSAGSPVTDWGALFAGL